MSVFMACQHINSRTNLRECEDQILFRVQALRVPPAVSIPQVENHCTRLCTERLIKAVLLNVVSRKGRIIHVQQIVSGIQV
jgi:hypothetical protein